MCIHRSTNISAALYDFSSPEEPTYFSMREVKKPKLCQSRGPEFKEISVNQTTSDFIIEIMLKFPSNLTESEDIDEPLVMVAGGGYATIHEVKRNEQYLTILISAKNSTYPKSDFTGLFGAHDPPILEISSNKEVLPRLDDSNITTIQLGMANSITVEKEILRLDPFGVIGVYFLSKKTRRNLTDKYGYWMLDPAPNNSQVPTRTSTPIAQISVHIGGATCTTPSNQNSVTSANIVVDISGGNAEDNHEKLKQHEKSIEDIHEKLKQYEESISKTRRNFEMLQELLREYYLDMDLADVEKPVSDSWYNRLWRKRASTKDYELASL
ncbi:hypothetical protein BGX27_004874 [Mortierella sp. AM989]|nr:hypothetical protein BGX27_004874 [Mortierella sp. AM989]